MTVAFASVHHDPPGLLDAEAARLLPLLKEYYAGLIVFLSPETKAKTRNLLDAAGATVRQSSDDGPRVMNMIGRRRREAVQLAFEVTPAATHVHLCDFDRILHWLTYHPGELREVSQRLPAYDFTVLGRTPRAYKTHPRVQRDTEAIINHTFHLASGLAWDVSAASRGVSRRAAQAIDAGCLDDTIGNDCSWPLYLQRSNDLTLGYLVCEGLEFETADRYQPEIAAAGGLANWIAQIDDDPAQWAIRLELARVEVESVVRYRPPTE